MVRGWTATFYRRSIHQVVCCARFEQLVQLVGTFGTVGSVTYAIWELLLLHRAWNNYEVGLELGSPKCFAIYLGEPINRGWSVHYCVLVCLSSTPPYSTLVLSPQRFLVTVLIYSRQAAFKSTRNDPAFWFLKARNLCSYTVLRNFRYVRTWYNYGKSRG